MLTSPNWQPLNLDILNRWLETLKQPRAFKPCAVFDFDHTTIFGDIADQTFNYQLQTRSLRISPEALDVLLGSPLTPQHATLKDIALNAYHHHHRRFCVATALYVEYIGPRDRLRWLETMAGCLQGFTEQEAEALGIQACIRAQHTPIGPQVWTCDMPELTYTSEPYVRAQPEIHALYAAIAQAGVPVRIVSASAEYIVRGAARHLQLPIAAHDVYGMLLQRNADGTLSAQRDTRRPMTYREGKAQLIETHFEERPIFVAGDTDNDVPMLTRFPETELRLIFDRALDGHEIGALYRESAPHPSMRSGITLLQGRQEGEGRLHPFHKTQQA